MKRVFSVLVATVAAAAVSVSLNACGSKEKPSASPAPVQKTAGTVQPTNLKGAVDIKGAFNNGSMWAKVGPVYRFKSGVSALALTSGYSKELTGYPATSNVGSAITDPYVTTPHPYSGILMLNDSEVFEPLAGNDSSVAWVAQDPKVSGGKEYPHSFKDKQKGSLQESVLVPFGDVGANTKTVGVSVGVIGFAAQVPVLKAAEAPQSLQAALKKIPQDNTKQAFHAPYSEFIRTPGMGIANGKKNLDVTLAADVFFDSGKWEIKPESQSALNELVRALQTHEPGEVAIVGHTDDVPDTNVGNQVLSENRAQAVKAVLAGKSELSGFTFQASGKAATEPAVAGTTPEARAKNRRVEVSVKTPVKKEILKLQAASAEMPPPVGEESTWPQPVTYDSDHSGSSPKVMQISVSKAVSYPKYTLVTFVIKSVSVKTMWYDNLRFEYNYHNGTEKRFGLYGADILRGQSRTGPLEYVRATEGSGNEYRVITGGSNAGAGSEVKPGYKLTIPVLYPPTTDKTITIDASQTNAVSSSPDFGWRIKDIPVTKATAGKRAA